MSRSAIAAIIVFALCCSNAPAYADLLDTVNGKWAVDGDCGVPAKTYVANVDTRAQTITWQDGLGNIDIEHIFYSSENEFRTMTEASFHARRSNSYGTGWIYTALRSFGVMRIVKGGKTFIASRCD